MLTKESDNKVWISPQITYADCEDELWVIYFLFVLRLKNTLKFHTFMGYNIFQILLIFWGG